MSPKGPDATAAADYDAPEDQTLTASELGRSRLARRSDGFDVPVTIRLSSAQVAGLKRLARDNGTTVSRLVRSGVERTLRGSSPSDAEELMAALEATLDDFRRRPLEGPKAPAGKTARRRKAS
jgi:hypothetical protein